MRILFRDFPVAEVASLTLRFIVPHESGEGPKLLHNGAGMGWETRRGKRYFYGAHRLAGKVKKTYVGEGTEALKAERKALDRAACRAKGKAAIEGLRRALEPLDNTFAELDAAVTLLLRGSLLAAGYHQHTGTWRLKRDSKN